MATDMLSPNGFEPKWLQHGRDEIVVYYIYGHAGLCPEAEFILRNQNVAVAPFGDKKNAKTICDK